MQIYYCTEILFYLLYWFKLFLGVNFDDNLKILCVCVYFRVMEFKSKS